MVSRSTAMLRLFSSSHICYFYFASQFSNDVLCCLVLVLEGEFKKETTENANVIIKEIKASIYKDINQAAPQGHRKIAEAIQNETKKIYLAKNDKGYEEHPKHYLTIV